MKTALLHLSAACAACLIAIDSRAQLKPETPPDDSGETVQLSSYVVTGSNIPTAADATDVPVLVLGKQQLLDTGIQTNALDLLRKSVPSFAGGRSNAGTSNASSTSQLTGGGSQLFLRNLPTLVLLNSRRVTYSSINATGNGKNFVDVNMFPMSAIDHVEVLSDGASAIYGSDAIGGVVNFIMKSNFSGVELGGRYGVTNNTGHYSERSAYVVAGQTKDAVSVTVTASWSKTDPLYQYQRPIIEYDPRPNTAYPGSVGGAILKYGLNSPSQTNPTGTKATAASINDLIANGTYLAAGNPAIVPLNIAPYTSILLAQELKSATADFTAKLYKDKLVLFGNGLYSKTHGYNFNATSLANMVQIGVTVPAGSPYNPTTAAVTKVVVGTLDTPQETINDAREYLGTLGLRGQINPDWSWEAGYTYSNSRIIQSFTNTVFLPSFAAAIAGGYDANGNPVAGGAYSKVISGFDINGPLVVQPALDPFARSGVNPASLANVYGTEIQTTSASLGSGDVKIVGMPFSLPAGKVGVAVGGTSRKEQLIGTPDRNSYNQSTAPTKHNWASGATFFDPFDKGRTVDAFYAELRAPLTSPTWNFPGFHAFDLSLAGRSEKYSDVGKSNVPKIGFRWQPVDEQFTLRFTYSKSFAAPFLVDEFGALNYALGVPPVSGINNGVSYYAGMGNNPNLGPAIAWSRSLGFVYSPKYVKGLTVSVNFINVFMKGYQASLGATVGLPSVNTLGSASPYFPVTTANAPAGQPGAINSIFAAPGSLYAYMNSPSYTNNVYFLDHKINTGGVHTRAFDFTIDYELPTASLGRFGVTTTGSYLYQYNVLTVDGGSWIDYAGYSYNTGVLGGSNSKWNVYTTLDWNIGPWSFVVGNFYRSKMVDILAGTAPPVYLATNPVTYVPYYVTWDAQVGYTVGKALANRIWGRLNGVKVTVGVNNVFNRAPPFDPLSFNYAKNANNSDVAGFSPIGRLFFVSFSVKL